MKNLLSSLIIFTVAFGLTNFSFAQDPAPAPAPGTIEQTQPAGTGLLPEASKPEAVKVEEPEKGTTLTLTPTLTVKPIALDKDLGKHKFFFGLEPSVNFGADFLTSTKKKINLSLGYLLIFEQYFNDNYERYFEHDLSLDASYGINDRWTVSLGSIFYLCHYYSLAMQGDNENAFEVFPDISYKITDKLTAKLGYYLLFFYDPNNIRTYDLNDAVANPPSDPDDIGKAAAGTDYSSGSTTYYYDPFYPQYAISPEIEGEVFKFWHHGITMELSYKFNKGTKGTFKYHYYPASSSNMDEAEFTGHQVYFVLNQSLWKGGNLNLQYRLRRRSFPYAFTSISGSTKVDYRHRIYVVLSHQINDYMSVESFWRLQHIRSNTSGVANLNDYYLGFSFTF